MRILKNRLIKGFISNSSGIIASRILGLFRDLLTANILGAGLWADIFFIAFKTPNLFRRIFGEGAFSQAFLPALTRSKHKFIFATKIGCQMGAFILLLCCLVALFSGFFTKIIATGLDPKEIAQAAPLVAINFSYLFFIYCVVFLGTLLQQSGHFATTSYSTTLLNLAMISALILHQNSSQQDVAYALSWAVVAGGVAQVVLHIIVIFKSKIGRALLLGLRAKKDRAKSGIKGFYKQFFKGLLGSSASQLSSFLDTWLASFLAFGSISYLFYANRLFQLPLSVFGIALSQVLFVHINRLIAQNKEQEAIDLSAKSFGWLCLILGSAMLFEIVFAKHIIWLLFQRGSFLASDTEQTANVLIAYALGLLPAGLSKLFSLWLYAKQRQGLAAKIAILSLVLNFIIALVLMQFLGACGIALASSISSLILLVLYIKFFGYANFCAIIKPKIALLIICILALEGWIFIVLKEVFNDYLR